MIAGDDRAPDTVPPSASPHDDASHDASRGTGPAGAGVPIGAPLAAYAALAGSMLTVGLCVTLGKMAVLHMPLIALAGVRCAAAILALLPLAWREAGGGAALLATLRGVRGRDRLDLVGQSLFGVVLFTLLMLGGVRLTGATDAGLIAATMPLAILVLAWPLLGERPRRRTLLAGMLGTAGIALLTLAAGDGVGAGGTVARGLGNLLVVGAVGAEALYAILAKRLADRVPPAAMALAMNAIGLALLAPLLPFQPWGALIATVPPGIWAVAALYGVLTSALALILWYRGSRRVPGATAGLFTALLPVGAVVSATLLLGEAPTARHAAGGAIILIALAVGLRRGGRDRAASPGERPRA